MLQKINDFVFLELPGVARFFLVQHTKTGKYTKLSENPYMVVKRPNGHKMYLPFQDPPKLTQIGIFVLKMHRLAATETKPFIQNFLLIFLACPCGQKENYVLPNRSWRSTASSGAPTASISSSSTRSPIAE
jgi:hypothetical protein